jgi:hypothetical protein
VKESGKRRKDTQDVEFQYQREGKSFSSSEEVFRNCIENAEATAEKRERHREWRS